MNNKIQKIEREAKGLFIELGFEVTFIDQVEIYKYRECYHRFSFVRELNSFVIESAFSYDEATKNIYEDCQGQKIRSGSVIMAAFWCKCGKRLSNGDIPNDIEYYVYSDKEWDDITNIGMRDSFDLPDPKYDVWRCPECERVYIFEENMVIKRYALEEFEEN